MRVAPGGGHFCRKRLLFPAVGGQQVVLERVVTWTGLEYLHLKQRVDMTNLSTTVAIGKRKFQLIDLLVLRRGLAKRMGKTYLALSTDYADRRLSQMQRNIALQPGEKAPHALRYYDEKDKFENLQDWQTLQDEIEQRLEVINATTDLVTI